METIFKCSLCGRLGNNPGAIAKCEQSHLEATDVVKSYKYLMGEALPERVVVKFPNGQLAVYEFIDETDLPEKAEVTE